ncbi:MAG: hypothetical protein K0S67_2451 [Nitrososphaeraceae archaeon]|jgi:hypothetical protein|nr:hypothetical protein [Nitrososphaeraceae archaeon]MCD6038558.1 hypothetical protein [Nitrososphaeraceae archaeon]
MPIWFGVCLNAIYMRQFTFKYKYLVCCKIVVVIILLHGGNNEIYIVFVFTKHETSTAD